MKPIKADICMLLDNPMTHDSRVIREATTLAGAGYKVVILAHYMASESDSLPEIEVMNGFTIYRFKIRKRIFNRFLPLRLARVVSFPLYYNFFRQFHVFDRLAQMWFHRVSQLWMERYSFMIGILKNVDATVIHAHDYPDLLVAYYGTSNKQKVVYDSHEIYFGRDIVDKPYLLMMNEIGRYYEKEFVTRCAGFITVGEKVADHLAQTLEIPRPTVIRNTVDLRTLEAGAAFAYPAPGKRRIVHTGGITEGRHLHDLVRSMAYLENDVALILMGSGPLETDLISLAGEIGVSDRVFIVPSVKPDQIAATAAQADVAVVLTSRFGGYNQEYSLPNKLFEAIAAGLPVVSGPNAEIARIVTSHEIGVVCDPQYPEQIANAIQTVLDDKNHNQFERTAKQAQQTLNWENEEKILLQFYDNLLD